jgi:acetylornithine deacetylase/succinyl-diaminopimelate desuccinylase-like protein
MHRFPRILPGFVAFALATAAAQTASTVPDPEKTQAEAVRFLADLVRIDTQDPPGNESRVADYLQKVLQAEGIDAEMLETVPGRNSIVARLKGDRSKRPLLLMAHEDVVPVDRPRWTVDPFGAIEKDGLLYGRGVSDDKARWPRTSKCFCSSSALRFHSPAM